MDLTDCNLMTSDTTTPNASAATTAQKHTIMKGYGYWDTTRYPVGGNFKRSNGTVSGTVTRIIDRYVDGLPHTVEMRLDDGRMAVVNAEHLS